VFAAWGRFVYRRRRLVALAAMALALLGMVYASQAQVRLNPGGWLIEGSESARVTERLADDFGAGGSSLIILFHSQAADAASAAVQDRVQASVAHLAADPLVQEVVGYREGGGDPRFISNDGRSTYVVAHLDSTEEGSIDHVEHLRELIVPQPGLTFQLTGYGPMALAVNEQSEADLQRAELVSLPLALLILVLVFASLTAALMPLLIAGLAIPSALALVYLLAQQVEMSIYVVNVATMLGLALAIDYSLFLVSRFREELARGRSAEQAVEIAMGTAGKAITFSGLAVAIGLLSLLFFESSALSSIGIGGSLVVLSSLGFALTFLPAVLGMLGPRVNALSLGAGFSSLRRRLGIAPPESGARNGRWEQVARWVMRRPVLVLVPTLILLLAAGTPFLRLNQAVPDASVLPRGLEARDAYLSLQQYFPGGDLTPFTVLVDVDGEPVAPANLNALAAYADSISAIEDIEFVESPFRHPRLVDPVTGQPLSLTQVGQLFAAPMGALPPEQQRFRAYLETLISGSTVRMEAYTRLDPVDGETRQLTVALRAMEPGGGMRAEIGGYIASSHDTLSSMRARTPWAVALTMVVIAVVLYLLFGSIVLPIKAVLMSLLSLTASFGALVWIFQEGNLAGPLNFEPLGYTVAGVPVIMFAILFGLSMDYEVLLLSRVQEAYRRTGDNTASVAEGLARTAAVITGAAAIMITVFAAFALADNITIKALGVGMAIAVFLDATIIRILLVPATMRLMGHWNWWAPGPLGRLADRVGFSHVETPESSAEPPVDSGPTADRASAGTSAVTRP
jgi:putative drug exporter of the RND superfamily